MHDATHDPTADPAVINFRLADFDPRDFVPKELPSLRPPPRDDIPDNRAPQDDTPTTPAPTTPYERLLNNCHDPRPNTHRPDAVAPDAAHALTYGAVTDVSRYASIPDAATPVDPHQDPDALSSIHHPNYVPVITRFFIAAARRARYDEDFHASLALRAHAAWRMTRELGRLRNDVKPGQFLDDALAPTVARPDPWSIPAPYDPAAGDVVRRLPTADGAPRLDHELIAILREANDGGQGGAPLIPLHLLPTYRVPMVPGDVVEGACPWVDQQAGGVAYMPPPVPTCYLDRYDRPGDDYEPEVVPDQDPCYMAYIRAMAAAAENLRIAGGSPDDPARGDVLRYLLHPGTCRQAWPTRGQVVLVEVQMVDEYLTLATEYTERHAREVMQRQYGFTKWEVTSLSKLAREEAKRRMGATTEEHRAMMLMRLESVVDRCRTMVDVRAELIALKQMTVIMGLADGTQHNSPLKDFVSAIRAVTDHHASTTDHSRKFVENTAMMEPIEGPGDVVKYMEGVPNT